MSLATQDIVLTVAARAIVHPSRFLVAVAGPPAAGKSTLARLITDEVNRKAGREIVCYLPMDGFHLLNADLRRMGLYGLKGAPETFGADAFVRLIRDVREAPEAEHFAPAYDRQKHDPDEAAIRIEPGHKVVIVEGNYLLLDREPWIQARPFYDLTIFLKAPESLIRARLTARHARSGKMPQAIQEKIDTTDIPNVRLINSYSSPPDLVVDAEALVDFGSVEPPEPATILGLGASTVDVVMLVDRFPTSRETHRALDGAFQGGGPVSTAMAVVGALGGRAGIIDRIGIDWRSNFIREQYRAYRVSTQYLHTDAGVEPSFSAILVRRGTAERATYFLPGRGGEVTADDIDEIDLSGVAVVHANGRHPVACRHLFKAARCLGIQSSFDGGAQRYSKEHHDLAAKADICIVAKDFAEKMTFTADVDAALDRMLREGPELVGITDGIRGSWLLRKGAHVLHQPAFATPAAMDTTGCGDSYHGAFLFAYTQGFSLARCAQIAAGVASINSTGLGGRGRLPTLAEVDAFIAANGSAPRP
jgi:sulfofructose kinase